MLLQHISERWPGLHIRTAILRHIRHKPRDLGVLARNLHMDVRILRRWLDGDYTVFRVTAWADALKTLHKYNKIKNKKKKGPRPQFDVERVQRIKEIGAHVYANRLLKESDGAFRKAAEALIDA